MSGGHFDYVQSKIEPVAEEILALAADRGFSQETQAELIMGATILRMGALYLQRIDWLVSGDDSEEAFHKRLAEDLEKLE